MEGSADVDELPGNVFLGQKLQHLLEPDRQLSRGKKSLTTATFPDRLTYAEGRNERYDTTPMPQPLMTGLF